MNDTTVWCQNASVTETQRELDAPETIRFPLRIGVLMRFEFLPVGTGVPDGPKNKRILELHLAVICSHTQSKRFFFSGQRTSPPTQKNSSHINCFQYEYTDFFQKHIAKNQIS